MTLLVWSLEEVKNGRSEWNREGSDDGLDQVYRRELMDLLMECFHFPQPIFQMPNIYQNNAA